MKTKYILSLILCTILTNGAIYAQRDSINLVWDVIFKADQKDSLSYNDIGKLIYSYKNNKWQNNVEFSECRTSAINSLLLSSHNLALLLKFLDNNPEYINRTLFDINPAYETGDSVYYYLNRQKGYNELKLKIMHMLK